MKRIIMATLVASVAPAFANSPDSKVTLYGSIRAYVDYVNGDNAGRATKFRDGSSRIGFSGADRLSDDLSVIWQVETAVNVGEGSGTWATRNSFVGFQGDFGVLRLGQMDSAYKRLEGAKGPLSTMFDSYGSPVDPKNPYGFYGRANARLKNSINYETPNFNGFSGRISYGVDNDAQNGSDAWITAISGDYTYGDLTIGLAYQYAPNHQQLTGLSGSANAIKDGQADKVQGTKSQAYKAAIMYTFDMGLSLGFGWEHLEDKWDDTAKAATTYGGTGKLKQDTFFVATTYPTGNWVLQAGYGWADKLKASGNNTLRDLKDTKAQMGLLGAQYKLSKRSRLYGYTYLVSNDANASFSTGYDSLNFKNGGGQDQTGYGVSLGLRTDF